VRGIRGQVVRTDKVPHLSAARLPIAEAEIELRAGRRTQNCHRGADEVLSRGGRHADRRARKDPGEAVRQCLGRDHVRDGPGECFGRDDSVRALRPQCLDRLPRQFLLGDGVILDLRA